MDWDEDLSANAREQMLILGRFSPTVNAKDKMIKGCMADENGESGKVYFDNNDLIRLADACIEVANWLEERSVSNAS